MSWFICVAWVAAILILMMRQGFFKKTSPVEMKAGHRYLIREWPENPEEVYVTNVSPSKKYIKFRGRWVARASLSECEAFRLESESEDHPEIFDGGSGI